MNNIKSIDKIIELSKLIYCFSRIPISILDKNMCNIYRFPSIKDFNNLVFPSEIIYEIKKTSPNKPLIKVFNSILLYSFITFNIDDEKYILSVGPALIGSPSKSDIIKLSNIFNFTEGDYIKKISKLIPIYDYNKFIYIIQMLILYIHDDTSILSHNEFAYKDLVSNDAINNELDRRIFNQRELTSLPISYEYEIKLTEYISNGNIQELNKLLSLPISGYTDLLSKDPLRQAKNLFISVATLITRTSIASGLDVEIAFNLSDIYIQYSEAANTISEVNELCIKLIYDFTKRIAENLGEKDFSLPVKSSLRYISTHLHFDISLEDLASHVHLSPRYLSKIFKKETGMTIVEYIQKERIKEAKHLLRSSNYTFLEISNMLNFVSQSYFIKVFKQHTGMTPLQYRKKIINNLIK